jgi:hypothetical protein
MEIEEAIHQLDDSIRRLKIQYDLFFTGANPRPPLGLRTEVDRLIRTFANAPIRRYSDRFVFNSLVGRYNSFVELWNKQLRVLEEGHDRPGLPVLFNSPRGTSPTQPATTGASSSPAAAATKDGAPEAPATLWTIRLGSADSQPAELTGLFERYLEARREATGTLPKITLASFARQISRQAAALRAASECEFVEFCLTRGDSQVTIKARPAPASHRLPDEGNGQRSDPDSDPETIGGKDPAREAVENPRPVGPR